VAGNFRAAASHSVSRGRWATRLLVFLALIISLAGAMAQEASAATASDNFNRANGNLTGTWTSISDGGLKITSQTVAGSVSGGSSGATWNAATFSSDQYSQVEVTSTQLTGGQWIGPAVRAQNGGQNTYLGIYFWNSGTPQLRVYKRISGTWIQLGSSYNSGALTAGTQLLLQASGSKITFSQNGVTRISVTDTSLTGGAPGIIAYGTGRADNWAGGDVSAPATFTVGGSVTGLSGTVVLQDNGGDNLTVNANGPFTFATGLATGAAYAVTVKTQPAGQTCTVSSGSGTMGSANVTNVAVSCSANPTFTVGGTVTGLSGTVVLQDNGGDNLTVNANGPFTFATALAQGAAYAVTVKTNPAGQTCTVSNGSGTMGSANVTNVAVSCAANPTFTVGGTVSGLSGTVVLQDNGADDLTVAANGPFTFATALATGAAYAVTVKTNPAGQTCTVTNGNGTMGSANVTNVAVTCSATTFTVGGTVTGLSGTVVLQDNGADNLTVAANGPFTFATALAPGAAYAVTVKTNPAGQTCTVSNDSGTMGSANVTNVAVSCAANPTFTVGGTVSGLSGTVVLQDNGGDNLTVNANGPFTFATALAQGAAYAVTVKTNPTGQTCTVTNGSGTIGSANVTNVAVSCAANPTFTVGGTVSGLTGTVVLQDNGADNLTVTSTGPFTFATALAGGAAYAVTVKTNPTGQTCTVTSGSGTIGSANVTNVAVSCSNSTGTTATDDFNRANGALGPNWVGISDGALTITSQTVAGTASGGTTGDIRTAETYGSNQSSQVEVTSTQLTGGQWMGPAVRMQNGGQSTYLGIYFWNSGSPQLRLYKRISGSYVQLGSSYSSGALAAGTQLQLQASGSSITFLQNGVARISVTDTSLTGGAPGVMAFGTGRADNWAGATLAAGPSYTVGGTLSGLNGGTLVLQDNGGDNLNLAANGSFTFATALPAGTGYSVAVASSPAGQACVVTNGTGTIGSANVTNVSVTCTTSSSTFSVAYQSTDANGVASYATVSAQNGNTTEVMRVLAPTSPAPGVPHNFLFVLPVEANNGTTFGDGIDVMRLANAQNQYNLTIIEPSFALEPWYADNPVNSSAQQETFMTQQLVPWVQANLRTSGQEQNWLIGFSKSGIGAEDLILKHPDVFTLAAAWDWPADMSSYDEYGSSSANSYGTDANFQASYRLTPAFLSAHKAPFTSANRLWIGGWNAFQSDMSDYDALLTAQGIVHSTETPTLQAHNWDGGWVPTALAALSQDSGNLPAAVTAHIKRPTVIRNARP